MKHVEDRLQVALMLATGSVAAAYSWSHVLDLAADHGQSGWRAWAVACVVETAAVSGGLEVRRRRRAQEPGRWAMAALLVAVVLQVAAQVARAEPSPWGVILAVTPAVVFLLLVKIALSRMPVATGRKRSRPTTRPVATDQADRSTVRSEWEATGRTWSTAELAGHLGVTPEAARSLRRRWERSA